MAEFKKTCAYCGSRAEGNYTIHSYGVGDGPEVDLCDEHGAHPTPTCEEIWARIASRQEVDRG